MCKLLNTTHNCLIKKPTKKYKTTEYSQTGRVPSTAAVLPRWMATAALCIKKWKERGSPDSDLVRWPSSLKNVMASEPNTPDVSMAMGTK